MTRLGAQLQGELAVRQEPLELAELQVDDAPDLGLGERVEDHDVVDAVQELGAEVLPQLLRHLRLGRRPLPAAVLQDEVAPDVRRHHDHAVAEVDRAALAVGEAPVVEDLQQDVEHVGVRLLDLVEEDDGVRPPAHGLRELPALLEADVARRRADEARHGVLLHVLRHVEPHHRLLVVEQELGQGAGRLRLPHARGPEEDKRADRPVGVLQPGARAAHRVGHGADRLALPDHALAEVLLELREALELGDPAVADLGGLPEVAGARRLLGLGARLVDLLLDLPDRAERLLLLLPLGLHRRRALAELRELALERLAPLDGRRVLLLLQRLALDLELRDAALHLVDLLRHRVDLDAEPRRRLV